MKKVKVTRAQFRALQQLSRKDINTKAIDKAGS
jgi:hypothetical protein